LVIPFPDFGIPSEQNPAAKLAASFERICEDHIFEMQILLIEDERKTANFLTKGLSEAGFSVDVALDGEAGLELGATGRYDLLVLDIMLPKKDGWTVVAELRSRAVQTPILLLTARDSVRDRVKGFELGADDYLAKPFAFSELLARIRSLLKRRQSGNGEQLRIDDLEIDLRRRKARRSGLTLDLTPKEFGVLALLARAQGEVVSRKEIIDQIWDINFTTATNILDVMVRRLRTKLDDPFEAKLIRTIRSVGYALKSDRNVKPLLRESHME
jgi:two-component system copper resistance phosphate regulon response regulator CusR